MKDLYEVVEGPMGLECRINLTTFGVTGEPFVVSQKRLGSLIVILQDASKLMKEKQRKFRAKPDEFDWMAKNAPKIEL